MEYRERERGNQTCKEKDILTYLERERKIYIKRETKTESEQ